ncbi:MAG: dihydroneopterin aldolase [Acidobacteriota bacterium]
MLDRVFVEGLRVRCLVGEAEWEHLTPQTLVADIELACDCTPAGRSDSLADALDYATACGVVLGVASSRHHRLLEALAGEAAAALLESFPAARSVRVRVAKPGAVPGSAAAGVEVERRREAGSG